MELFSRLRKNNERGVLRYEKKEERWSTSSKERTWNSLIKIKKDMEHFSRR
jgi:hypothetical protein